MNTAVATTDPTSGTTHTGRQSTVVPVRWCSTTSPAKVFPTQTPMPPETNVMIPCTLARRCGGASASRYVAATM